MEPMKPDAKARILEEQPHAQPGDLEEYELLLSQRFTMDPDVAAAPGDESASDQVDARLEHLHRKLFPDQYAHA
jgi:hypothetical protein